METQTSESAVNNLILDYKIVCVFGIFNSIWHLAAGILWQLIRIPQISSSQPFSYFGGYLSLIGCSEMLIFIYLLLFYCRKINKSKNLFTLRFVVCIITIGISLLVLMMICAKTAQYICQAQSKDDKWFDIIIALNTMDILITIYSTPSYIFISICHYRQLQQLNNQTTRTPLETDRQNLQGNQQNEGRIEQNVQIRREQQTVNIPQNNLNNL